MEFRYTATDKKGRRLSNVAVAENVSALVLKLKDQGLVPIQVYENTNKDKAQLKAFASLNLFADRVSSKETTVFTRQLAATLKAGLLLTEALDVIADDLENHYFAKVIRKIVDDVRAGSGFADALTKHKKIFDSTYVAIVRSGEATGRMDLTMTSLAKYLEATERLKEKVKSAITYPSFVVGFAFLVVAVIVFFLIPKFKATFDSFHAQLPLITRIVVGVSEFAIKNFLISMTVMFGAMIVLVQLNKRSPKFKYLVDQLKFKIPVLGKHVIHKSLISRFCRTMGFLIASGVGLSVALEISAGVVDHLVMSEAIEKVKKRVLSGSMMSDELRMQKVFPKLVSKMAAVGERSGQLSPMLIQTADYYDDELENSLHRVMSLLEPCLIVFVGMIVLVVVLAMYMPIFKMSTVIR